MEDHRYICTKLLIINKDISAYNEEHFHEAVNKLNENRSDKSVFSSLDEAKIEQLKKGIGFGIYVVNFHPGKKTITVNDILTLFLHPDLSTQSIPNPVLASNPSSSFNFKL